MILSQFEIDLLNLSTNDRAEMEKFERYVIRRKVFPNETEKETYEVVYGEVIFDES